MTAVKKMQIGFLVFDGFPMSCLTSMIEPLRAANEIAGQSAFGWEIIAERAGRVMSSAEVAFDAGRALAEADDLDMLIVLSSPMARFDRSAGGAGALRRMARHGGVLGAISGGVFPLARAGLVGARGVSVHWCYEAAFHTEFPDLDARRDVIVSQPGLVTISGAAAAFDYALRLIDEALDPQIAHEVACWFQHPKMRGEGVGQIVPVAQHPETGDALPDLVARAVTLFAARMGDGVQVAEVARETGVSPRQIERAFKAATGQSPVQYFRQMRMKAARQLVCYSDAPVAEIAAAVGYSSAAPLQTHYRAAFGLSPAEDRRRINQFRVAGNAPVPAS